MKTLITASLLALASCALLPSSLTDRLKPFTPKVSFQKLSIKKVSFTQADVDFVFSVQNPNPLQVKLSSFRYQLDLEGVKTLEGSDPNGLAIAASGSSDLSLPVSLVYQELYKTVQAVKGKDDIKFGLSGEFGFMTPAGEVKLPFKEEGSFPAPRAPKVSFVSVHVDKPKLLSTTTSGEVQFKIANEHASPIDFKDFNYDISLNKLPASKGNIPQMEPCPGNSEITVKMPIQVNLLNLGSAFISALTTSNIDFKIAATLNVNTSFGVLPLTINQEKSIPMSK
jgi:LEA14-like dessication related protein